MGWFEGFGHHLFQENGYNSPPISLYESFLAVIDRPGKILELGCGNGLLLRFLCDNSAHLHNPFGVDCSPHLIHRARTEIFPDLQDQFQVADILTYDFAEAPFALIITNPLYADQGYREQIDGRIQKLAADGSIRRYVHRCFENLAENGRLILFCYHSQLEEIRDDRSLLERELSRLDFKKDDRDLQPVTFFLAEKCG